MSRTDPKERQSHGSIFCYFGGFFFGGLSYEIFLITAGRCLYYWAFFVLRVCPFMRCWAAFVLFSVFCFKGVPFHALLSSKGAQLPISNLGLRWAIQGLAHQMALSPPPGRGNSTSCVALGRLFGFAFPRVAPACARLRVHVLRGVGPELRAGGGARFGRLSRKSYLGQRRRRISPALGVAL